MRDVHAAASTPGLTDASCAVVCAATLPVVQPKQVSEKKKPSVSGNQRIFAQVQHSACAWRLVRFPERSEGGSGP